MSYKTVSTKTEDVKIDNKLVHLTTKFHSKDINGLRTLRREYTDTIHSQLGGWMAGTVTETVVTGAGKDLQVRIPEHRVA